MEKEWFFDSIEEKQVFFMITKDQRTNEKISLRMLYEFVDSISNNEWWYYDCKSGIVHILVEKSKKAVYVRLLDELCPIAAKDALEKYSEYIYKDIAERKKGEKSGYRTRKKAGDVAEVPSKMPNITNRQFMNAITYNNDKAAYLQPITSAAELTIENGIICFEGLPASAATIKHLYTKENIEDFDLPLLRVFYAIILNKFRQTWIEDQSIEDVITIYYPDLAKQLGKSTNMSRADVVSVINNILSFRNVVGVTKEGGEILPVLSYWGEDRSKHTISFASPYIVRVIKDIYNASIRKSKQGLELKKKDGLPQLLPAYTYLPNLSLAKERNKKAVEIVCIVVTVIENAGTHGIPHISAKTIIERNLLLKNSLENTKDTSNQNKLLKRAFSKAWELLRTNTDVLEKYKNIQLPDPKAKDFKAKWIPTMGTLNMVFEFPHEGKIKE